MTKITFPVGDGETESLELSTFTQQPPPTVIPPGAPPGTPWPPWAGTVWHGVSGDIHVLITLDGYIEIWNSNGTVIISWRRILNWLFPQTAEEE